MTFEFDGTIDISTGRHRKETSWKNKQILWSDLVKKLSVTHRTAETHAEYLAAKKPRQDEIKDIGGFVGGYLSSGRRKAENVLNRRVVTLDADFSLAELWDDFTLIYGNAAVLYSTHKHSGEAPRYRLIIPLDREVMPDEYMAIARRIAGVLGINFFDHTTFQPERLMYWPSTSKDGSYVFQYQDGPWINADEVLATYRDWHDSSEWPVGDRESAVIKRGIAKQGDPLEKPGVIGAFCRTYNIHEAIETFLSDVYEPTDFEDRYTYKEGSTAAGLVVYEDKFTYSHHGTDPVSGKLCNAFDLVRIHKFGLKDEDAREDLPINKKPSFLAMQDLATKDPKVKKQIGQEILQNALGDFAQGLDEQEEVTDNDWTALMDVDRKGNYYNTINNIVLILENDQRFKSLYFDAFVAQGVWAKRPPWRKEFDRLSRFLTDRDADNIEHLLEKDYKISSTKLDKALNVIFEKTAIHPVRDYLSSQQWDGEGRIDRIFIDYMGAEDTEYIRAVTRKTMVAAVARVFRPGIKFDYVLTLIGEQGKKKSTLLKALAKDWFSESFHLSQIQTKEAYEQMRGVWIIEIGEMAGMAKAEVERIKSFISAQEDRYRQAYGRRVETFPRQCIFFGTTNKPDFLRDQTGNRRFWPVQIDFEKASKDVHDDLTSQEIGQIWAEAVQLYKEGETLYLPEALEKEAAVIQKKHTEEHPWTGLIRQYLEVMLPEDWSTMGRYERLGFLQGEELKTGSVVRDRVCAIEIWQECLVRKDTIDDRSSAVITGIMRNMEGWVETPQLARFGIYGRHRRGFFRVTGVTNGVTAVTEEGEEVSQVSQLL